MEQGYKYMVSIRCLTYNHAPYIVDAMNGFTKQETTFPVVTLIVDDASTDGEQDVIRQYLSDNFQKPYQAEDTEDYKLVCANHKENPNCTFAVFFLKYNHYRIKKSKFEYLTPWSDKSKYYAFCEGDDYWIDSHKLQEQVSFLESHPTSVMSHTAIRYYLEKENKYYNSKDVEINTNYLKEGLTLEKILRGYRIQFCSVVCRQDAYNKARKSDPYLFGGGNFKMGDTQLWYQLLKEGKISFYPKVCAIYRKHAGSATKATNIFDRLSFKLSSAELRMYLVQRDNLSAGYTKYVSSWYGKSFIRCLAFDRKLKPKYTVNLKEDKFLYCLFKLHLLKQYICISASIKSRLNTIKRYILHEL